MQYVRSYLNHVKSSFHAPRHSLINSWWLSRVSVRHMGGAETITNSNLVMARVLGLVKKYDKIDVSKVTETADFQKDLGLDSLDKVELVMALEQEFSVEIPDEKADKLTCCADIAYYILSESKTIDGKSNSA